MEKKSAFEMFGSWLRKQNMVVFSIIIAVISALTSLIISAPFELGWVHDIEWFPIPEIAKDGYSFIVTAVIIAPLIETLLFQMLPMVILWRFKTFRQHRWIIVLIAALIFGIQHFYSLQYIIVTIFMGAVMMWGYIVKFKKNAYWNVAFFHFLWNGTISIFEILKSAS